MELRVPGKKDHTLPPITPDMRTAARYSRANAQAVTNMTASYEWWIQARYRAARAAGTSVIRTRRPADHRSRARRWHDTIAVLVGLQAEYAAWLEALPANLQDSAIAEALQAISDLDLGELQAIEPPHGFGRD